MKTIGEPKEDCIFMKNKYECNALNALYCKSEGKCNFYKSNREYDQNGYKKKAGDEKA